jgi:hypothetical protein
MTQPPPRVWQSYDDLPGWKFSVEELSPGAYRIEGRDVAGRSVSLAGGDPDRLLQDAKAWAIGNADAVPSRPSDAR